ncbi:MAG: recombination-associated protein RdgC [Gammaproteobacteria bacterium]|nr:recombination-associated protein RdgC [Gammaproteobacteria bacterium]
MFFRNLTLFRFPTSLDFDALDSRLDQARLKPVGPLDLSSRGFVSPFAASSAGHADDALSHRIGDAVWLTVGGEDKLLPAAVVNDLLARKLATMEQREGRRPGGRARKRLKEDLVHELLPRAFVRPVRTDALLDLEHGLCVVDTASRKNAEAVVGELRQALGSFPALPLNAEVAPRAVLTGWIAGEELPEGLSLGLRKFRLLDGVVDRLESTERDDIRAELDARLALMAAEVKRLFAVLQPALKLSRAES